jgi:hypothetical protein
MWSGLNVTKQRYVTSIAYFVVVIVRFKTLVTNGRQGLRHFCKQ